MNTDTPPNSPKQKDALFSAQGKPAGAAPDWERKTLEKLAFAALSEQRARRRWGIFFRILGFVYLVVVLAAFMGWGGEGISSNKGGRHTAVIDVLGSIGVNGEISADKLTAALRAAFENPGTAGVVLRINSPGGSPVQAGIIHDEMRRLRQKYPEIPLYAVVEDLCASGGYYIAVGADKIYVDKASIVGSIGVLMNGFGFTGTMEKLGVERRLLTAGENKGFLDPFSPMNPTQKAHVESMLAELHQQFANVVRQGRGERLKETPEIFSGLVWSGETSVRMGLADGLGTVDSVARDVIKVEKRVDFSPRENLAERFAKRFGADAASGFGQTLTNHLGGQLR
ncbi:MAG: S49 family peptidase [Zoogloeaceae bacterium]|jgi:protease-4|nr:S49 family peptidase [Zoogloeaceae bacterium]